MSDDEQVAVVPSHATADAELNRQNLRRCWELASVIHFLRVFGPVIKTNLKVSAEEIETALIEVNDTLAQLHTALLKGLVSASKMLNGSDAWVVALSKTLKMWWPWVAQGDFPLIADKGEELSRYKELDPTTRLIILRSLCEVRADQDDIASYINDAIKEGNMVASFQKEKLGENKNGTVYWYDGDEVTGHRLYREVYQFERKPYVKGKQTNPGICTQWETVATNLEEFRGVVDKFSTSKVNLEVAVCKAVESDAIPALVKLQQKKERALRKQQQQERLLNAFQSSRLVRSSRHRKPIDYRYDEYDRDIEEAIEVTQNSKKRNEQQKQERKEAISQEGSQKVTDSEDSKSTESNADADRYERDDDDDGNGSSDDEYNVGEEDIKDEDNSGAETVDEKNNKFSKRKHSNHTELKGWPVHLPRGSRYSRRLAGIAGDGVPENININSKNRPRQTPSTNAAIHCSVVPDSEDEDSLEVRGKRIRS